MNPIGLGRRSLARSRILPLGGNFGAEGDDKQVGNRNRVFRTPRWHTSVYRQLGEMQEGVPPLENSTGIRRKAQKLTQKGAYADAIVEYEKLSALGELEPYDLVVVADLLSRSGRRNDAVNRYLEAMDAYQNAGLNRNAIALGKKIQRLAPKTSAAHRRLGDLYAADDLGSESCLHYLEFLDQLTGEGEDDAQSIEEICVKLLKLSLPSFNVVKRIVDKAKVVDRASSLVPGILHQAERARAVGNAEAESELRKLAHSLDSVVATQLEQDAATGSESGSQPDLSQETNVIELDQTGLDVETEIAPSADLDLETSGAAADELPVLSLEGFTLEDEATNSSSETPERPALQIVGEDVDLSLDEVTAESEVAPKTPVEEKEPKVFSLDGGLKPGPEPAAHAESEPEPEPEPEPESELELKPESKAEPAKEEGAEEVTADVLRARGMRYMEENDGMRAQRELMRAASLYFEEARSAEAGDLYETVVKMDPNHLEALRGLVEIAHINGEKAKMAHWGSEFGDVLLAREKYAEAKVQFERVLAFDPHNVKSHSRLKRLKTIAGVKDASFGELVPTPSEVEGAQVTIRDDESSTSQSALDLNQILDEFRAAVVERIPADDSQSHYDLGMTFKEMGLIEEAAVEFETASQNEENRLASMEMLAECYLHLNRAEEAIQLYEQILVQEESSNVQTFLQLGRAREALGQWDQAAEEYNQVLNLVPDHQDALEALMHLEHRREQGTG